jgi:hypothetical protein
MEDPGKGRGKQRPKARGKMPIASELSAVFFTKCVLLVAFDNWKEQSWIGLRKGEKSQFPSGF